MRSFLLGLAVGIPLGRILFFIWDAWPPRVRDHYLHEYSARRCGGGEITLAQWEAMRTPFTEGPTQRGNGNDGPTTSKPQPAGGRLIGPNGAPIGYQPRPSRPGANPPPSEP
jgi:hypothetical protein